jgi:alpha-beta hydrolase superfamily lysophospholipase
MRRAAAAALLMVLMACGGPDAGDLRGETVEFTTDDGVRIVGDLYRPPAEDGMTGPEACSVVLLHMFPSDRRSWRPLAGVLVDRDFSVLAIDFRGYGDSQGEKRIDDIWRDALAAVHFMRREGHECIVLVGASMGGTAALIVAAREPVDGVVTLSAASTFMGLIIPPEAMALITAPKLFIAAQGDASAAATAQQLYAQSPAPKRVEIVNGNEHGTDMLEGAQAELVRTAILNFLATDI